jgi:glycosyltransferase involved in cell wall biosynthesis
MAQSLNTEKIQVSIVIPCLNEAESLAAVINEVREAYEQSSYSYEILVADNGSTDGSQSIAQDLGCLVINVTEKGYGEALLGGMKNANGEFVVMADADGSYHFQDSIQMIPLLVNGSDLVMGNRFAGGIEPGAMPWLHRWVGNPILSSIGRLLYRVDVKDFHCGLRGYRLDRMQALGLKCSGMEFASEMVVMASLNGLQIDEVPVKLHPDLRTRKPHLRRWRDGWRHLTFLLVFSPTWLFALIAASVGIPGILVLIIGIRGAINADTFVLSYRTAILSSVLALVGVATAWSFAIARDAVNYKVQPVRSGRLSFWATFSCLIVGIAILLQQFASWAISGFGQQEIGKGTTLMILGATLFGIGGIGILLSIVRGVLRTAKR